MIGLKSFTFAWLFLLHNVGFSSSYQEPVDRRIDRLENILSNRQDMQMINQIEDLQSEIRTLRGQIEDLNHEIGQVKELQKVQYSDLDRRLSAKSSIVNTQKVVNSIKSSSLNNAKAKQVYFSAYNALSQKRYGVAEKMFKKYIDRYPQGEYLPNSYYWVGEIFLQEQDIDSAIKYFKSVYTKYPKHNKAADALLKVGYALDLKGDSKGAFDIFDRVISEYSSSAAARLAQNQKSLLENSLE